MDHISFPNIEEIFASLSGIFAIVALIVATIFAFLMLRTTTSVKLLGSVMVLALAFAAHNAAVYALGIFIIATLVTDLDFLEKLAAIFWNRDKYWEYRLGTASPSQVVAKVTTDAQKEIVEALGNPVESSIPKKSESAEEQGAPLFEENEIDSSIINQPAGAERNTDHPSNEVSRLEDKSEAVQDYRKKINETIARALNFEQSAQLALQAVSSHLNVLKIHSNAVISTPAGPVEVDAIVSTPDVDLVIEIKYSKRPHVWLNVAAALQRGVQAYSAYGRQHGRIKKIIPVAVLPTGINGSNFLRDNNILVLKLDPESGKFVNINEFKLALENYS